jgi:hypothetical protein
VVERVVHIDDVRGSNPLSPTMITENAPDEGAFFVLGPGALERDMCVCIWRGQRSGNGPVVMGDATI